jgi:hypothetical protein
MNKLLVVLVFVFVGFNFVSAQDRISDCTFSQDTAVITELSRFVQHTETISFEVYTSIPYTRFQVQRFIDNAPACKTTTAITFLLQWYVSERELTMTYIDLNATDLAEMHSVVADDLWNNIVSMSELE